MTILKNLAKWLSKHLSSFGEEDTAYTKPQQLVERARCGDQVAIAIISRARKAADVGDKKAIEALEEIKRYARENAPTTTIGSDVLKLHKACSMGQDIDAIGVNLGSVASKDPETAAVTVSNSCNAVHLAKLLNQCLNGDKAFQAGFKCPSLEYLSKMTHEQQHAFILGFVLGMAARIQYVRRANTPIAAFSQAVAWEVGQ